MNKKLCPERLICEREKRIIGTINLRSGGEEMQKPELVLKQARYLNVFSNQWERADIAVEHGRIVGVGS